MIMKKIIFLSLILVIFLFGNISTVTASETQYTPVQITNLTNSVVSGFNGMILSAGLMTAFPQAYFIAENINPAMLQATTSTSTTTTSWSPSSTTPTPSSIIMI